MLIAVEVASFALESDKHVPLVVMRESRGERSFTMPVSVTEANAIAMHSLNVSSEKPLAIDLVKNIMESLGGSMEKVVLIQTGELFSAQIVIIKKTQAVVINCGAGDALALALRCNAPVFIDDATLSNNKSKDGLNQQELRSHIARTDTLEFGRYYL
jgi:bifunctional DNase/RNase